MCLVFVSAAVIIGALLDSLVYRLAVLLPDRRLFACITSKLGWLIKESVLLPMWCCVALANLLILVPQDVSASS